MSSLVDFSEGNVSTLIFDAGICSGIVGIKRRNNVTVQTCFVILEMWQTNTPNKLQLLQLSPLLKAYFWGRGIIHFINNSLKNNSVSLTVSRRVPLLSHCESIWSIIQGLGFRKSCSKSPFLRNRTSFIVYQVDYNSIYAWLFMRQVFI